MAKPGGGGEKSDFESNALFIGVGGFLLLIGAWFILGPYISSFLGSLRRYEMVPFAQVFEHANFVHSKLVALDGRPLDFKNTVGMLGESGIYIRWLYIPILPVLAFVLFKKSTRLKYQKQHSMASLAKQESSLWPEIAPVVGKQDILMNSDEHSGEWAVALTEWEFAEKHKLATHGDNILDKDAARSVFVAQLGPLWSGPNRLPPHLKGLYAAFLLRIAGESERGLAVLRIMSKSFAAGGIKGMDTSFADSIIEKYGNHPNVQRAISQHAYVTTVMATLLQLSRADGVLASPMFIWLKTVDRVMFYLLNNVGRYAFHVECAGVAAHWLYEKTVGESCSIPMVESAISRKGMRNIDDKMQEVLLGGLEMALQEYTEDDALDRLYK